MSTPSQLPVLLVVGGSGQVGTALRKDPAASGYQLYSPASSQLDLTDTATIATYVIRLRPTIVINAAAYTAVDRAEDDRERAFTINATGAGALATAAERCGARFVQLSTDYVFDGAKPTPYLEREATNAVNVYGASKAAGERAVMAACPGALVLRVSWVFSATGTNFVKTMLRLGASQPELKVVADQRGTPCSARSIAQVIFRLLADAPDVAGIQHFGSRPPTTWYEFARTILESGRQRGLIPRLPEITPITTEQFGARAPRPANSVLDTGALGARLGIEMPAWQTELDLVLDELRPKNP